MFLVSCFFLFVSFHVTQHLQISPKNPDLKTRNIITTAAISTQTRCQIVTIHQRLTCSCNTSVHFVCVRVCVCGSNNSISSPVALAASQLSPALSEGFQSSSNSKPPTETMLHINLTQILGRATSCGLQRLFFFPSIWGASKLGHIWSPKKSSSEGGIVPEANPLRCKHYPSTTHRAFYSD